jgi:MoaA/NifB/PqqE/SkfB family radical SAM enzyme
VEYAVSRGIPVCLFAGHFDKTITAIWSWSPPLTAAAHEDVCHFLCDASAYGFIVRTVEAGFLPLSLGSVRARPLADIYRDDSLLGSIRAAAFTGRCGGCEYANLCGGSRARAYAATGDPLGPDPACPFQPGR